MRHSIFILLVLSILFGCSTKIEDNGNYPPADLVFYETYEPQEFQIFWLAAMSVDINEASEKVEDLSRLKMNKLSSYVQPGGPACLGYVKPENKQKVFELLNENQIKNCFPTDAEILWSWNAEEVNGLGENCYSLHAVHKKGIKPRVTGKDIKEVEIEEDAEMKRINILLTMTDKGTERWSEMTADNINRSIAVVVNDKVLSAPRVMGEITGGQTAISGNFSLDEAKEIAGGIRAGIR